MSTTTSKAALQPRLFDKWHYDIITLSRGFWIRDRHRSRGKVAEGIKIYLLPVAAGYDEKDSEYPSASKQGAK